jgi:two-component system, cell cycle response regulator
MVVGDLANDQQGRRSEQLGIARRRHLRPHITVATRRWVAGLLEAGVDRHGRQVGTLQRWHEAQRNPREVQRNGTVVESTHAFQVKDDRAPDAMQIEAVIARALTERGERFLITASRGRVSLPAEANTLTRALQIADERMYSDKAGRSRGAGSQTHAVLTRILDECDPALHSHARVVTQLASAVGRGMGLDGLDLDHLVRAATLHDIGKVAIPDAILDAPRALTEPEWELMRTHTILGERVLSAAPALSAEAMLVRSSHERWDGAGYPDGLMGPEIPLGSRIILACDAFEAMTSPRSYRTIRSAGEALAELRRCAGSQFDPGVVAALADALPALLPACTADHAASDALAGA